MKYFDEPSKAGRSTDLSARRKVLIMSHALCLARTEPISNSPCDPLLDSQPLTTSRVMITTRRGKRYERDHGCSLILLAAIIRLPDRRSGYPFKGARGVD